VRISATDKVEVEVTEYFLEIVQSGSRFNSAQLNNGEGLPEVKRGNKGPLCR